MRLANVLLACALVSACSDSGGGKADRRKPKLVPQAAETEKQAEGNPGSGEGSTELTGGHNGERESTLTVDVEGVTWSAVERSGSLHLVQLPTRYYLQLHSIEGGEGGIAIGGGFEAIAPRCESLATQNLEQALRSAGWGMAGLYQYPRDESVYLAIEAAFQQNLRRSDLSLLIPEAPATVQVLVQDGAWSTKSDAAAESFRVWAEQGATGEVLAYHGFAETHFSLATLCDSYQGKIYIDVVW